MKQGFSGSHLMGQQRQQPRDRLSSSYDFTPPAHRAGLSTLSRNYAGGRFMTGASSLRNDYERYLHSLAASTASVGYGISETTLIRNAAGYAHNHQGMLGYIPPGTHSVPASFHGMQPPPAPRAHHPFLPPLRPSQPQQYPSTYDYDDFERFFSDEEPFFPLESVSLPPIPNPGSVLDFNNGGYNSAQFYESNEEQFIKTEKLAERLETFPELPMDAHKRIFHMGNEIVDCVEVHLERFFKGSLLDSAARCLAVFTKKERTGQRWLMVFKEDINRSVVKFNRLLTHSLLVRIRSPIAVEIEAAKTVNGPPAEMCVLNFRNEEDANRFHRTLHESQTTAWNHREVTHEQRMKSLFQRINAVQRAEVSTAVSPPSRSPFTLGSLGHSGGGLTPAASPSTPSQIHISDMDNDWRNRGASGDSNREEYLPESPITKRNRVNPSSSPMGASSCLFDSMTHKNALKMDGSGDSAAVGGDGGTEEPEFLEEVTFEYDDGTLFIKTNAANSSYEEVGQGKLRVIDHGTAALNEIVFSTGKNNDPICSQYIFRWNSVCKEGPTETGTVLCQWDGTAALVHSPTHAPDNREFKIEFQDNKAADKFIVAFRKGVEKGSDPVVKKRHVSWFIKNRGHSIHRK